MSFFSTLFAQLIRIIESIFLPLVEANVIPDFIVRIFIRLQLAASLRDIDTGRIDLNAQRKIDYVKGVHSCPLF